MNRLPQILKNSSKNLLVNHFEMEVKGNEFILTTVLLKQ